MHHAKIEKSRRLQRILNVLADGKWHSTLEINKATQALAINSAISELRKNGFTIDCQQNKGDAPRAYYYQLETDHDIVREHIARSRPSMTALKPPIRDTHGWLNVDPWSHG